MVRLVEIGELALSITIGMKDRYWYLISATHNVAAMARLDIFRLEMHVLLLEQETEVVVAMRRAKRSSLFGNLQRREPDKVWVGCCDARKKFLIICGFSPSREIEVSP